MPERRRRPVHRKYDGDAAITPSVNGRYRVWVEAPNVTAEVYIDAKKAREIMESLASNLNRRERSE